MSVITYFSKRLYVEEESTIQSFIEAREFEGATLDKMFQERNAKGDYVYLLVFKIETPEEPPA